EALEARAALHQEHAHRVLELLDARREGRLANSARFRRMAEMSLSGERDDEFELIDHEGPRSLGLWSRAAFGASTSMVHLGGVGSVHGECAPRIGGHDPGAEREQR